VKEEAMGMVTEKRAGTEFGKGEKGFGKVKRRKQRISLRVFFFASTFRAHWKEIEGPDEPSHDQNTTQL
jgi:hypothetical protein